MLRPPAPPVPVVPAVPVGAGAAGRAAAPGATAAGARGVAAATRRVLPPRPAACCRRCPGHCRRCRWRYRRCRSCRGASRAAGAAVTAGARPLPPVPGPCRRCPVRCPRSRAGAAGAGGAAAVPVVPAVPVCPRRRGPRRCPAVAGAAGGPAVTGVDRPPLATAGRQPQRNEPDGQIRKDRRSSFYGLPWSSCLRGFEGDARFFRGANSISPLGDLNERFDLWALRRSMDRRLPTTDSRPRRAHCSGRPNAAGIDARARTGGRCVRGLRGREVGSLRICRIRGDSITQH